MEWVAGALIVGAVMGWVICLLGVMSSDRAQDQEQLSAAYSRGCGDCRCQKAVR